MSVSSLTSSASSQSQLQSLFARIDTDKSGTVSAEELSTAAGDNSTASDALSALSDLLSTADADGDGALGGPEFESAFNQLSSDMQSALMSIQEGAGDAPSFSDLDTDGSNSLSYDEFAAGAPDELSSDTDALQQLYTSIDTDGDGSVSQDEFSAFADGGSSAPGATATSSASTQDTSSASGSSATGGSSSAGGSSSTKEIESETTVTNPDGSTTTTITYTDGTSTTTTTPASPATAAARQNGEGGATQPAQASSVGPAISAYESALSASVETSASLDVAA